MSVVQIGPKEFQEKFGDPAKSQFIDIREPFELDICKIAGATHMPMAEVKEKMSQLDKEKAVIVCCRSGGRSNAVAGFLVDEGFKEVYNLAGGVLAWASEIDPEMETY